MGGAVVGARVRLRTHSLSSLSPFEITSSDAPMSAATGGGGSPSAPTRSSGRGLDLAVLVEDPRLHALDRLPGEATFLKVDLNLGTRRSGPFSRALNWTCIALLIRDSQVPDAPLERRAPRLVVSGFGL